MCPHNLIENLGHGNMSTQKLISLKFNTLEYMIKTFLTFSYRNHFQEMFRPVLLLCTFSKTYKQRIIFYLPEVLHPVDKILLQHTITFGQDY